MIGLAVQYLDCTGFTIPGLAAIGRFDTRFEQGIEDSLVGSDFYLLTRATQFDPNGFGVCSDGCNKTLEADSLWVDVQIRCNFDNGID